jgi:hypothetical protein
LPAKGPFDGGNENGGSNDCDNTGWGRFYKTVFGPFFNAILGSLLGFKKSCYIQIL